MCSVVSAKGFDSKRIRLSRCHHPCWLPSVLPDTRVSIESDGPEQNTHTYHDQKQERKYIVNEKQRKHVVIPSRRPADVQQRSSARVRLANSSRPTSSEAETMAKVTFVAPVPPYASSDRMAPRMVSNSNHAKARRGPRA